MSKIKKWLMVVKVLFIIYLFAGITFATDPGGPPSVGIGSNSSGPLGGSGPKVCGQTLTDSWPYWAVLGTFLFGGLILGLIFVLSSKPENNPFNHLKPAPYVPEPDQPPIPVTGGESRLVEPSGATKPVSLKLGSNSIGRSSDQDISINDPKVSKKHADINVSPEGRYVLTDMGSQNGTFVNGKRITQQDLCRGDQIELGDSRIIV